MKFYIIILIFILMNLGCSKNNFLSKPLTVEEKLEVVDTLSDTIHELDVEEDVPVLSTVSPKVKVKTQKVLKKIIMQLKGKASKKTNSSKNRLKVKKAPFNKHISKLHNNLSYVYMSGVLRPFKPRYCSRLLHLKSLRRKIITHCIIDLHQLGFLARMRVRLSSTTNLLLNADYGSCTTSRTVRSLEAKIKQAASCLENIKGMHTIVSPVGLLNDGL